jgi:hypothetical protein
MPELEPENQIKGQRAANQIEQNRNPSFADGFYGQKNPSVVFPGLMLTEAVLTSVDLNLG